MADDEGNPPEIKDVLADIDLKADQLRSVIFSNSLLDIMTALSERHGYQAVKAATEALRPVGGLPINPWVPMMVWALVRVAIENMPDDKKPTLTAAFDLVANSGGVPYPHIKEGEYERKSVATVATIKKWYHEVEYANNGDETARKRAESALEDFSESFKASGKPLKKWLKIQFQNAYQTSPKARGEMLRNPAPRNN